MREDFAKGNSSSSWRSSGEWCSFKFCKVLGPGSPYSAFLTPFCFFKIPCSGEDGVRIGVWASSNWAPRLFRWWNRGAQWRFCQWGFCQWGFCQEGALHITVKVYAWSTVFTLSLAVGGALRVKVDAWKTVFKLRPVGRCDSCQPSWWGSLDLRVYI